MRFTLLFIFLVQACTESTTLLDTGDSSSDDNDAEVPEGDAGPAPDAGPPPEEDAGSPPERTILDEPPERAVSFVLNAQDFSYVATSHEYMERLLELHERTQTPLDIYLTDTALHDLEENKELFEALSASPFIQFGYHTRPPKPYRTGYDWADLASQASDQRREIIRDYETHLTDPELGTPTETIGGIAHLRELVGDAIIPVGVASDLEMQDDVDTVFAELGADFFVSHSTSAVNLGDRTSGGYLERPEHVDLPLIGIFEPAHAAGGCFQEWSSDDPAAVLDAAIESACDTSGSVPPCIVGVKMHDNDFFACDSAWTSVYLDGRRSPPFSIELSSEVLSDEEQERRWEFYEGVVMQAVAVRPTVPSIGIREVAYWTE